MKLGLSGDRRVEKRENKSSETSHIKQKMEPLGYHITPQSQERNNSLHPPSFLLPFTCSTYHIACLMAVL